MKKLVVILFVVLPAMVLLAEVSDTVWTALLDRGVTVEKLDGSEVVGTLIGVAEQEVNVMKKDGTIVTVRKDDVKDVRGVTTAAASETQSTQRQDIPLDKSYVKSKSTGIPSVRSDRGHRLPVGRK